MGSSFKATPTTTTTPTTTATATATVSTNSFWRFSWRYFTMLKDSTIPSWMYKSFGSACASFHCFSLKAPVS